MKRSMLLLAVIAVFMATFAGCEFTTHSHVFGEEYATDANGHWRVCTVEGCAATSAKEAHDFDCEDETAESHVCVCSVCSYQKTKGVTTVTAEEWDSIFEELSVAENSTFKRVESVMSFDEILSAREDNIIIMTANVIADEVLGYERYCIKNAEGEVTTYEKGPEDESFKIARENLFKSLWQVPSFNFKGYFDKFTYSEQTGCYVCSEVITEAVKYPDSDDYGVEWYFYNATVKIVDGKVEYLFANMGNDVDSEMSTPASLTWLVCNIGTSEIVLPKEILDQMK